MRHNKRFLLCVGAQKGGTTWLWHALQKHKDVDLGFTKEYHFFDALYHEEQRFRLNADERAEQAAISTGTKPEHLQLLMEFYAKPECYYQYFKKVLSQPGITLTGDFTPSYSMLSEENFRHIRASLIESGFDVKVVFIMREPYDRVWSACRMHKKNNPELYRNDSGAEMSEEEYLNKNFDRKDIWMRTQYHQTVKALQNAFPKQDVQFLLYEDLFSECSLSQLFDFLGLSLHEVKIDFTPINKTKRAEVISLETISSVREHYAPVVDTLDALLPELRVKQVWEGYER
ncbi:MULTISPECIES: sulfotransferase domain-containing protein [Gammaproteobacteria]|uniref:sulfotransferase domain-containing protein n=1 Tax=Gammaproteobacteria TaxID=1236 RepID=UPI001403161C|nr:MULTISPECIES: sulfotransferase domain-containing protein [Gammaproteobacteria]